MTLILTHLSQFGIIHASDSNLTAGNANSGTGQKTFPIPYLNAGLTVAGAYSVGGSPMDRWMAHFIATHSQTKGLALPDFSNLLRDALETTMTKSEKALGSMVHISGYVDIGGVSHPEFWFVRNVHQIDLRTGNYGNITNQFAISEDFWTRDCPRGNLMKSFQQGTYQIYVNGFAPGRISYVILQSHFNNFLKTIWSQSSWKFRPPRSLQETEKLVNLYLTTITTLFLLSNYSAQYIGGGIQLHSICRPKRTATTC